MSIPRKHVPKAVTAL